MFREILLATTALLGVTSITSAEARSAHNTNADHIADGNLALAVVHRGQDKNNEFLCTYGGYKVSSYSFSSADRTPPYYRYRWTEVAAPIKGSGRTVDTIVVQDGGGDDFNVAIYSNSKEGKPGGVITGGSAYANADCDRVKVRIPKTFLDKGKEYWVVESVAGSYEEVSWAVDPVARHNGYSRYFFHSSSTPSYTSPWRRIKTGPAPFVRVK